MFRAGWSSKKSVQCKQLYRNFKLKELNLAMIHVPYITRKADYLYVYKHDINVFAYDRVEWIVYGIIKDRTFISSAIKYYKDFITYRHSLWSALDTQTIDIIKKLCVQLFRKITWKNSLSIWNQELQVTESNCFSN